MDENVSCEAGTTADPFLRLEEVYMLFRCSFTQRPCRASGMGILAWECSKSGTPDLNQEPSTQNKDPTGTQDQRAQQIEHGQKPDTLVMRATEAANPKPGAKPLHPPRDVLT